MYRGPRPHPVPGGSRLTLPVLAMALRAGVTFTLCLFLTFSTVATGQASCGVEGVAPCPPEAAVADTLNPEDQTLQRPYVIARSDVDELHRRIDSLTADVETLATSVTTLSEDNKRLQVLENLRQAELLASFNTPRYVNAYGVLNAIDRTTLAARAQTASIAFYNSLVGLTDLSEYPGFSEATNFFKARVGRNAKSYFTSQAKKLKLKVLPESAASLAAGVLGNASLAIAKRAVGFLASTVGGLIRQRTTPVLGFGGGRVADPDSTDLARLQDFQCGLATVSQIYEDVETLASETDRISARFRAVDRSTVALRSSYHEPVVDTRPQEEYFAGVVVPEITSAVETGAPDAYEMQRQVQAKIEAAEALMVEYYAAVASLIGYYERQKVLLTARMGDPCVVNRVPLRQKYEGALANMDCVIERTREAYLFGSDEERRRVSDTYFRSVVGLPLTDNRETSCQAD